MKIQILIGAALSALLFSGCESSKPYVVVDSDRRDVVTMGIDPADFKRVADAMRQSISASGVLNKYQPRKAVIGVSTVVNKTAQRVNVENLTDSIMTSLNEDARMMINRGLGANGRAIYEDYMGAGKAQRDRFREDAKQAPDPDYTLSGYINETRSSGADAKQYTYTIHLRLTDGETVAWQGHEEFRKRINK